MLFSFSVVNTHPTDNSTTFIELRKFIACFIFARNTCAKEQGPVALTGPAEFRFRLRHFVSGRYFVSKLSLLRARNDKSNRVPSLTGRPRLRVGLVLLESATLTRRVSEGTPHPIGGRYHVTADAV